MYCFLCKQEATIAPLKKIPFLLDKNGEHVRICTRCSTQIKPYKFRRRTLNQINPRLHRHERNMLKSRAAQRDSGIKVFSRLKNQTKYQEGFRTTKPDREPIPLPDTSCE